MFLQTNPKEHTMLKDTNTDALRVTTAELARLRRMAAKNGHTVHEIHSTGDMLDAIVKALPLDRAEDMLRFIDDQERQITARMNQGK